MKKENIHLSMYNTAFEIDLNQSQLIEVCNPENKIRLSGFQKLDEKHLWLPYGLKSKNLSLLPSDQTGEWQARLILPKEVLRTDFEGTDQQIRRLNAAIQKYNPNIHLSNSGLPIYTIDGSSFIVDVRNKRVCEQQCPKNEISILDMHYHDSCYLFSFDRIKKNISWKAGPTRLESNDDPKPRDLEIRMPHMTELDPKTMSILYGYPLREIQDKTDFEVMVNQQLFRQRQQRKMTSVNIWGKVYNLNLERKVFIPKIADMPELAVKDFLQNKLTLTITGYLDTQTHTMLSPKTVREKNLGPSVVRVDLPQLDAIDPYGVALAKGWNVKETLLKYPLQKRVTAQIGYVPTSAPMNDLPLDIPSDRQFRTKDPLKEAKKQIHKPRR